VIDVNAVIPSGPSGAELLVRELDAAGIGRALVRHRDAVQGDPATANRRAAEAANEHPERLCHLAVVAPLRSEPWDEIVTAALRDGAVGFWLESASWLGSPASPSTAVDGLLRAIARTGRPLLVPIRAWGDGTAIAKRTAGLGIAVILVGAHYNHIVDDLAAATLHEHLHLDMSSLAHMGGVERAVAIMGHERLLLGTGLPGRPPTSPVNAVRAATISDAAKRAILGGNAARIFGLPEPTIELVPPILALDAIDVHTHLGPHPWDTPDPEPEALADILAAHGIERAIASSVEALTSDPEAGNATIVAACAREPRLLGYLVADPNDRRATREQLRRWGDAPGIVGVKVHCQYSAQPTGSALMADLFALLADHDRPVKIHVDGPDHAPALRRLADRHPRLTIISAHAGPGAPSPETARVAAATPNVYLELASSFAGLREVREVVEVAGRDRVLFGTDAPLLDPAWVLGTYHDAGLDPVMHERVYRHTAERLFQLPVLAR
jgi:predicted TIM-barrel fold metal-dependent hydrolase